MKENIFDGATYGSLYKTKCGIVVMATFFGEKNVCCTYQVINGKKTKQKAKIYRKDGSVVTRKKNQYSTAMQIVEIKSL